MWTNKVVDLAHSQCLSQNCFINTWNELYFAAGKFTPFHYTYKQKVHWLELYINKVEAEDTIPVLLVYLSLYEYV